MSAYLRKYATATASGTHVGIPMIVAGSNNFATSSDWTPAAGDVKVSIDGGTQANIGTLPTYIAGSGWVFVFTALELTGKSIRVTVIDSATKAVEDQFFSIETYGNASALHPFDLGTASTAQTADVAAVKAKTDSLTFTATGKVDANTLLFKGNSTLDTGDFTLAHYLAIQNGLATQADINALNQSASRRVIVVTVPQYERPESSSNTYTIEARTYDGDGAAVNADSTPTLTATGIVTGSLAANLSAATNAATGVYRWTYTVASGATLEQVRFDLSAAISSSTFTMTAYTQVADFVAATFTTADRASLTSIVAKLPSKQYIAGTSNSDGDVQMDEATGNFGGSVASVASGVALTSGERTTLAGAIQDLADGVETGLTPRQLQRIMFAAIAGLVSGAGGTTPAFRNLANTKNRISATVDASGNRTSITFDLT